MSPRGCVAWIDPVDGAWRGVYSRCDSYPTGLLVEILEQVKAHTMKKVLDNLKHLGDWEEFRSGDNRQHGNGEQDQFDPRGEALFIERVYLLHPEENAIEVRRSARIDYVQKERTTGVLGKNNSTHFYVGTFSVNDANPNKIEANAKMRHKEHYVV